MGRLGKIGVRVDQSGRGLALEENAVERIELNIKHRTKKIRPDPMILIP